MTDAFADSFGSQDLVLFGRTDGANDPDFINFAHDLDREKWLRIPRSIVSSVKPLDRAGESNARVAVTLTPGGGESAILASVVTSLESAIKALARRVGPALSQKSDTHASDGCVRCLEACKLIVLTENDPFAQITCMLSCSACP